MILSTKLIEYYTRENELPFVLLLDEMKIKSGLVFNKNSGELVGFSNLGEVNQDIDKIISRIEDDTPYTPPLAKKMLAFMIRPVHKPSLAFIVAAFPTTNISGSQLFPVVWEVIEALELNRSPFFAVVVDGASPNRQFFKLCCKKGKGNIPYKTKNPYANQDIYFICDPLHLMKTTRNCFSNSHAHKKSRELQVLIFHMHSHSCTHASKYTHTCTHTHTHTQTHYTTYVHTYTTHVHTHTHLLHNTCTHIQHK